MGKSAEINLDSFLDIMTCLVGILILILILTSIDATQVKVLIPTPMQHATDKRPIYIECRDGDLYQIPLDHLRKLANARLGEIAKEAEGDTADMLRLMNAKPVQGDNYSVDLTYTLLGEFAINPVPGGKGYHLEDMRKEKTTDWFGRILASMDKESQMLAFLVRDDSFKVFKHARALAWQKEVEVSYELLDVTDTIKFGLGGSVPMAQ